MTSTFSFPTRIVYGAGCRRELPELLSEWNPRRVLIVTDPGITKIGLHVAVTATLDDAGIPWALTDAVEPNPVERNVHEVTAFYQENECDVLIGLGGGSALDVAKAVRLRATHPLPLAEYDELAEGWKKTHPHVPPMIGIPTTAGTGSEVGRSAVITLETNRRKTVLFSPYLMPNVALLDPELTVGLPPHLTAATGMDALTHSVEAYLSKTFHPFCDGVALHGIRLCATYLPRAVANGRDLEARGMMLLASAMGATAFQKGLGVAHALAHPLSSLHGIHHGLANAIVLPTVLRFNRDAAAERLADVAHALGCPVEGLSALQAADKAVEAVERLVRRLNLPTRLAEVGIREEHIPPLAAKALEDGCHLTNPRPVSQENLQFLYRQAL